MTLQKKNKNNSSLRFKYILMIFKKPNLHQTLFDFIFFTLEQKKRQRFHSFHNMNTYSILRKQNCFLFCAQDTIKDEFSNRIR